jgi:hypothetical protein
MRFIHGHSYCHWDLHLKQKDLICVDAFKGFVGIGGLQLKSLEFSANLIQSLKFFIAISSDKTGPMAYG